MFAGGFINRAPNQQAIPVRGTVALHLAGIAAFVRGFIGCGVNVQLHSAKVCQHIVLYRQLKGDGFRFGGGDEGVECEHLGERKFICAGGCFVTQNVLEEAALPGWFVRDWTWLRSENGFDPALTPGHVAPLSGGLHFFLVSYLFHLGFPFFLAESFGFVGGRRSLSEPVGSQPGRQMMWVLRRQPSRPWVSHRALRSIAVQ